MPIVTTCCRCCSLQTGAIGAGVFALVDVALLLFYSCTLIYRALNPEADTFSDNNKKPSYGSLIAQGAVMTLVALAFLVATCFLFFSVRKDEGGDGESFVWNRRQMATMPWIGMAFVRLAILIFQMVMWLTQFLKGAATHDQTVVIIVYEVGFVIYGGIMFYFVIVVISYSHRLLLYTPPVAHRLPFSCQSVELCDHCASKMEPPPQSASTDPLKY